MMTTFAQFGGIILLSLWILLVMGIFVAMLKQQVVDTAGKILALYFDCRLRLLKELDGEVEKMSKHGNGKTGSSFH
jgi:hypothetical protein